MAGRSETVELVIKLRQVGDKVVRTVKQQLVDLKNTVFSVRTAVVLLAAAYAGIRIGKELIEKSDQQAVAVAKLHTALVSMGRYTPELETGLLDTAKALQEITNYGDEATTAGQAFLVTYKGITDDLLPRSSKTMLDLAALMGGDTVQAANMLGKASMGMTGELRRAGITVEESTFKLRGYAGVLEEIEAQVKGQAEAQREATGSLTALNNKWGDVHEKLGDILKLTAEPVFRYWLANLEEFDGRLDQFLKSDKVGRWVDEVSTDIVAGMATGMTSVSEFKVVWLSLKSAIQQIELAFGTGIERILAFLSTLSKAMSDVYNSPFNLAKHILPPGTGEILKEGADDIESYRQAVDGWNQIIAETIIETDNLGVTAAETAQQVQETVGRAVEAATAAKQALKDAQGGGTGAPAPTAPPAGGGGSGKDLEKLLLARIQSTVTRAKALADLEIAKLQGLYERGALSVAEYFDKRKALIEGQYQTEVAGLRQQLALEKDAAGQIKIQDDLFIKLQDHEKELLDLAKQRAEAEKQVAENRERIGDMLRDLAIENMDTTDIAGQQAQELALFEAAWSDKLDMLRDAKATEDELLEFYHQKELARLKLAPSRISSC